MKKLILIFILTLFSINESYACSCLKVKIKENYKSSDLVFIGKVKKEQLKTTKEKIKGSNETKNYTRLTYTFQISKVLKGDISIKEIEITTSGYEDSCGTVFDKNQEYLVYSYMIDHRSTMNLSLLSEKVEPYFTTDLCTRTNLKSKVKSRELRKLNRISKRHFRRLLKK